MRLFTADMLGTLLSVEDVPPRHSGGRPLVLTCKACNSTAATALTPWQPTAKLPQLLLGVALGKRDEDTLATLAARLGYGASRADLQRVGGVGDGGIDGVISLDKLGLEKVAKATDQSASNFDLMIVALLPWPA